VEKQYKDGWKSGGGPMGADQHVVLKGFGPGAEKNPRELNQFIRVCKRRHGDVSDLSPTFDMSCGTLVLKHLLK